MVLPRRVPKCDYNASFLLYLFCTLDFLDDKGGSGTYMYLLWKAIDLDRNHLSSNQVVIKQGRKEDDGTRRLNYDK